MTPWPVRARDSKTAWCDLKTSLQCGHPNRQHRTHQNHLHAAHCRGNHWAMRSYHNCCCRLHVMVMSLGVCGWLKETSVGAHHPRIHYQNRHIVPRHHHRLLTTQNRFPDRRTCCDLISPCDALAECDRNRDSSSANSLDRLRTVR